MEIRNIDPTDESKSSLHAEVALGPATVVHQKLRKLRTLSQSTPAPIHNPLEKLIERANQNAGEVDHRLSSHKIVGSAASLDPPATSQPYFVHKDDKGNEVWWNPQSMSYEVKDGARKGGMFKLDPKGTDETKQWNNLTRPDESVPSAGSKCLPPLDSPNHQHAEIVRTDFGRTNPHPGQSAPSYPAPKINQHAEVTGTHGHFLQNFPKNHTSTKPCPSAPNSLVGVGSRCSPVGRCLRSISGFLRKLAVKVMQKSAYNDPSKVRVNGRWVRREDFERYN